MVSASDNRVCFEPMIGKTVGPNHCCVRKTKCLFKLCIGFSQFEIMYRLTMVTEYM